MGINRSLKHLIPITTHCDYISSTSLFTTGRHFREPASLYSDDYDWYLRFIDSYTKDIRFNSLRAGLFARISTGRRVILTLAIAMDVTSLLNAGANANAVEQQKKAEASRTTPTRNRTPWDAGGYALPINTMSGVPMVQPLSSSAPAQDNVQMMEQESIQDTPVSPKHRFSDSRSSLSSFTSSLQSASHSRYSSLSTVGSLQQPNTIEEALSRTKDQSMDTAMIPMRNQDANRTSPTGLHFRGSISPTSSMDALVLAAERHSVSQRPNMQRNLSMGDTSRSQTTEKPSPSPGNDFVPRHRPCSPSDAILIKRTAALPILRVMTGDKDLRASDDSNM